MAQKIAIIGAGSWGTALARLLGSKGLEIRIWAYERDIAESINAHHKNPTYLSEIVLPDNVTATADIKQALVGAEVAVLVTPSHVARKVWGDAGKFLDKNTLLVSCTKGIESDSLKLMHEVMNDCLPGHLEKNRTILSGPSFAREVAKDLPTSVVIAGKNPDTCKKIQDLFRTDSFLTFTNSDVIGVEVGGAIKNVIAIAAGMSDGLLLGHNSRATIITRGLYEMIKIGKALGGNPLTFAGLSGIGDLILTCTADLSRNHTVGKKLGEGMKLAEILKDMVMVAEGVSTARAIKSLTAKYKINAPICNIVYQILYEDLAPKQALINLCKLRLTEELGSLMR